MLAFVFGASCANSSGRPVPSSVDPSPTTTAASVPGVSSSPIEPGTESKSGDKDCIASGKTEQIIAALDNQGDQAVLCPGSIFELSDTIEFTAPDQALYTLGKPTDGSRATLSIASPDLTVAVSAANQPGAYLGHLQIDGNRDALGVGPPGGLIEWGGNGADTVVEWVRAFEPRGWSILVLGHGDDLMCRRAAARHNELGPAGRAEYVIADGISLACRDSIVEHNTIVDATDGGIVIFQAPGSYIGQNTIRAEHRIMFYGISMVDSGPYGGDFGGTRVVGNRIEANGELIRYGIPMGPWVVCMPDNEMTGPRSRGAVVRDNLLTGDKMGYGFVMAGVEDWTALANVDESTHLPGRSDDCFGRQVDAPGGFQVLDRVSEGEFQSEFEPAVLGWGGSQWRLHVFVDESCLAERIGSDVLAGIRSGRMGPIWPSLEETPGGEFTAQCMETFVPPLMPAGASGIVVAVDPCVPFCIGVRLMNWGETAADLSAVRLHMNQFLVSCPGLPPSIEPGEEASCRIDRYVGPGFNLMDWYGIQESEGSGLGFQYPYEG